MVAGHRGDERGPRTRPHSFGQEEALGLGVEEAHSPGAVIEAGGHPGGIVFEALRVVSRRLGLEPLGELADVVQAQEVAQ